MGYQGLLKRVCFGLELYDVGCLGAFGRVDDVELHLLAFSQRLEAAVLNVSKVNEHISAFFTGYESKTFGIIEPLYGTVFHGELPPSCELKLTEMCDKKTAKRKVFAVLRTKNFRNFWCV
jgi:hypothetical protein